MATQNVCRYNKFGYCRYKETCRNLHENEVCESQSCEIYACNKRHPRHCRYYRDYNRCKFNPCKFKHVKYPSPETEIEKLREDQTKVSAKVNEIDILLNEKMNLEKDIKICNDKLDVFEKKIQTVEETLKKKESQISQKKNILERVEALEKICDDKDKAIEHLTNKIQKLEQDLSKVYENKKEEADSPESVACEFCEFSAKNERGLKLHMKAKHEITKIEIQVFCKATEKYLSSDRDNYRKEIESEIDVLEDVVDMDIDS